MKENDISDLNSLDATYWKHETLAFLALQSIKGIGFKTLRKLAAQNSGFFKNLLTDDVSVFQKMTRAQLPEEVRQGGDAWQNFKKELWKQAIETAKALSANGTIILFKRHPAFPIQLRSITPAPEWLFIQGNINNLYQPSVAVVGSRDMSAEGEWLTTYAVAALKGLDSPTISGLALGIDQKAHQESLRFGVPTVAVLGTGIDSNYPAGSEELRNEIIANNGTIVSEYLLGQSYSKDNFVQRNRIQAGLARLVIPIQWKIKSGTAHTVAFAKSFERAIASLHLPLHDQRTKEEEALEPYLHSKSFTLPEDSAAFEVFLRFVLSSDERTDSAYIQTSLDL